MRRILLFLIFSFFSLSFLCASSQPATALTPLDASTMDARVLIMNTVEFQQQGSDYRVDQATGRLTWFPRETPLQSVTSLQVEPQAEQSSDAITFSWDEPRSAETIQVSGTVRTRNAIVPVRQRIAFPLQDVPPEVAIYLEPGEITDENAEIQKLSQELADGKTDAYEVVYTLADWTTTNVNYSLASAGQPAIQKSSQVLRSRYGKCDELTALFISMNRALGIPARFVGGYAYTTSEQFETNWGGHGWAEVWLPGQGWVPFDVTYGEYGYLDAGHITLKVAPDAKETSVDYSSRGAGYRMATEPLDITVTPTKMTERASDDITISVTAPQERVGFGSAVLIEAEVRNNRDYYVSTRLDLSRTANSEAVGKSYANILLRPRETKKVRFVVRISDSLTPGYSYTFPFTLRSRLGPEDRIEIIAVEHAGVFDESTYAPIIDAQAAGGGAQAAPSFSVTCAHSRTAYVGEQLTHECSAVGASDLRVCDEKRTCSNAAREFQVVTLDAKPGVTTRAYTAESRGETVKFYVTSRSVEKTRLAANMSMPAEARPHGQISMRIDLSASGAMPQDVNITLKAKHGDATQHIDALSAPATLLFDLPTDVLRPGKNDITMTVVYRDEVGTLGRQEFTASTELVDVTFWDRLGYWLDDLGYWLDSILG